MISSILLSAGESQRFGSPKALARINGTTAIGQLQTHLLDCGGVDEIIIVLGADQNIIEPHVFNHKKVRVVYNKDYKLGQTSSFQTGIRSANLTADGFLMIPVDCPFIKPDTFALLIKTFLSRKPEILLPLFEKKRGHPPIFNSSIKNLISVLEPHEGINSLFKDLYVDECLINDAGIIKTFNTPSELESLTQKEKDA